MSKFVKGHKFYGDQSTIDRLLKYALASKGKPRPPEVIEKIRQGNLGKINPKSVGIAVSLAQTGRKHSKETIAKRIASRAGYKHSPETIAKIKAAHIKRAENSPIKSESRTGAIYKAWRLSVYTRDNWICQKCLIRGGTLHAHHIRNFSEEPSLRFDVNNGITLCENHHYEFHDKYGRRKNNEEQISLFLKAIECE